MDFVNIYNELLDTVKDGIVKKDELMKNHTTLSVGGNARILVEPANEKEIYSILKIAKEKKVPVYIIGRGSNLLVSEKGLDGIVMKIADKYSSICICDESMIANSGAPIASISKLAMKNSLTGLEFASGIPGTLGGAIAMNAGAYGGEITDIVEWVRVIKEDGTIEKILNKNMDFSYRKSILTRETGWIVLDAKINLKKGVRSEILKEMTTRNEKRVLSQPLHKNNCGSTFKRPDGHFAGKLIEDCGLKGFTRNGVEISSKHAGFVVNNGQSSFEDMMHVINLIKKEVYDKFSINLEEEVKILR